MKPLCLSIGGLDPTGGAGVLLDHNVLTELEIKSFCIVSVLTSQTTDRVLHAEATSESIFRSQLDELFKTYKFNAVKVSLVASRHIPILLGHDGFRSIPIKIVDPILKSSSGYDFINKSGLEELIKYSTLCIPNREEAYEFLGEGDKNDILTLATSLREKFDLEAVLLKGGHFNSAEDVLVEKTGTHRFKGEVSRSSNEVHGTGCLLSSAIMAGLAKGLSVEQSIKKAKSYLSKKLSTAVQLEGDKKYSFLF